MKIILKLLSLVILVVLSAPVNRAQDANPVVRLDPALDEIVSADAQLEKVAGDFGFLEGPVWVGKGKGYLLFSDIPNNVINKLTPDGKIAVFLKPSGYTGTETSEGGDAASGRPAAKIPGSNAVTLDRHGRVVFCAQGDRKVIRLEKNGRRTVLVDGFEGKTLNNPNDLVYKSDGALYFTDPRSRIRKSEKGSPFDAVYLLKDGKLQVLDKTMAHPNGIAFAPGEKYLYVNDSDKKTIIRYEIQPDDTIANGKVLIDMTEDKAPGYPDGMKVDTKGNVYCTGPGGFWIVSPEGKHLGTVKMTELPANFAFGDADGKTLYLTAHTGLYRIRLKIPGIRP